MASKIMIVLFLAALVFIAANADDERAENNPEVSVRYRREIPKYGWWKKQNLPGWWKRQTMAAH
ncbi:hypothetical protein LSH36_1617g00001 [Paralvinella palmiformis]|uniref:Uncharacterized protein n=1 Tax=Paralvinella palmiformis TaxID=53620 RepID=A0AAD9IT53_9ANNE|nr:hypothetical protein LSH36_1617g00001 [Paralvinella palmiformis]